MVFPLQLLSKEQLQMITSVSYRELQENLRSDVWSTGQVLAAFQNKVMYKY